MQFLHIHYLEWSGRSIRFCFFFLVSKMLWITLLLCICVLTFNYVWRKRKFYYLSWHMKGPIAFPFIGNAWMFLNSSSTIYLQTVYKSIYIEWMSMVFIGTINIISMMGHKYGSLTRFWLGTKLLVYINSPEDMETLINAEIQDKGDVYDNISDLIGGHGLLSLNGKSIFNYWK